MPSTPLRAWLFTVNNYDATTLASIVECAEASGLLYYLCYGLEVAPSTGTPHVQGFLTLKKPQRTPRGIKKYLEEYSFSQIAHFSRAEADGRSPKKVKEDNRAYCAKTRDCDEIPNEVFYENPAESDQGRRSDLETACDTLRSGGLRQVALDHPVPFIKYHGGFRALGEVHYTPRDPEVQPSIWWWYGPTGTGKTATAFRFAKDNSLSIWKSSKDLTWWQGYTQQQICLIDDFRKDFCKFHTLLTILDRYPHSVEVKGSSVPLNSPYIIVTSCYPPWQVYDTREDVGQLLRRVTQVVRFDTLSEGDGGPGQGEPACELHQSYGGSYVPGTWPVSHPCGGLRPRGDERPLGGFTRTAGNSEASANAPGFTAPVALEDLGVPFESSLSTDELIAEFMR